MHWNQGGSAFRFECVNTDDLFAQTLPLVDPWTIAESRFEGEPKAQLWELPCDSLLDRRWDPSRYQPTEASSW